MTPLSLVKIDPAVPTEILALLLLLGSLIFLWDLLDRKKKNLQQSSGLKEQARIVAVKGSETLPGQEFSSQLLGLTSRPDALIREDGYLIPVDVVPLGKKVKDRHVGQLMVHLRLIEEREGKRPPYGLLIVGPEGRRVQIKNTPEKQRWLSSLLDEMHSIIDGVPALAAPAPFKCKSCDVRSICAFSAAPAKSEEQPIQSDSSTDEE